MAVAIDRRAHLASVVGLSGSSFSWSFEHGDGWDTYGWYLTNEHGECWQFSTRRPIGVESVEQIYTETDWNAALDLAIKSISSTFCACGCGTAIASDRTWTRGHHLKIRTPEQIAKWRSKMIGRKLSDEHKINMSKSLRGIKKPGTSAALKGRPKTKAHREAIRKAKSTPEAIERQREIRAGIVVPFKDSKIEMAVQEWLTAHGVLFDKHVMIDGVKHHRWDLVLQDRRVVIEVDGCYWHGCHECERYAPEWEVTVERDRKHNEAAKSAGWTVVRVWGHEVKDGSAFDRIHNVISVETR